MTLGLVLGIVVGTLVAEDATAIATGSLIAHGLVPHWAGLSACIAGIYLGDLALWRLGRAARERGLTAVSEPRGRVARGLRRALSRHLGIAIIASRWLPGTRLPLYVGAGAAGTPFLRFALWTFVAVVTSVPVVVLGSSRLTVALGPWPLLGALLLIGALVWRKTEGAAATSCRRAARARRWIRRHATRLRRWEYWPAWVLYVPVGLWIAALVLRHRSLAPIAAANPGLEDGGFAGETKAEILAQLPEEWTIPGVRFDASTCAARLAAFDAAMTGRGWSFPVALKPDVGQRGLGVRRIATRAQAIEYLAKADGPLLVQPWRDLPCEAGIYYLRRADALRGRITSITDKRFPVVVGDGVSTLEDLVHAHPRFHAQAPLFLARHAADRLRVLGSGERFALGQVGNHAQGTMFLDGRGLWSEALEARIDEIARGLDGFHIGRFDIRYADLARFRAGLDLSIVELNGVTSEPTHIYDPGASIVAAIAALCRHWSDVFAIGAAHIESRRASTSSRRLLRLAIAHVSWRRVLPLAD